MSAYGMDTTSRYTINVWRDELLNCGGDHFRHGTLNFSNEALPRHQGEHDGEVLLRRRGLDER